MVVASCLNYAIICGLNFTSIMTCSLNHAFSIRGADRFAKVGCLSVSQWYWEAYFTLTGSVLAFSADAERLITFDKPFARRAAKL